MPDTPTVRTHAHRVTEASFIVGNEAAILGALEGRDREIEALRARVGWEVAERDRERDEARVDGARAVLDKVREIASSIDLAAGAEELADTLNGTICALDPAVVVGSGS